MPGVKDEEGVVEEAKRTNASAQVALDDFFSSLPKDRLFYLALDDLQEMFLISVDGVLSENDVFRARVVLKKILRQRSNVMVAITGSCMAIVWSNILNAPANGRAVYSMLRVLALPSSTAEPALASVWARLKADWKSCKIELSFCAVLRGTWRFSRTQ